VLTGARQVGKSTLLLNSEPFCNSRFHTLDDLDTLEQGLEEPEGLWAGANEVVIDEVQRAPDILVAVKRAADRTRRSKGLRFVLSGSANLLLMRNVSESLAGRAVYFVLEPMTLGEMDRTPAPLIREKLLEGEWPDDGKASTQQRDATRAVLAGLMPALLELTSQDARRRWWEGYVSTYLDRDLRQLSQVQSVVDFRGVMGVLALRSGQIVDQSELACDAQMSEPTVDRYLNLLETSHLFGRLPAYRRGRTSRLIKSPKAYWADPGSAVFLAGYFDEEELRGAREMGGFFENLIFHHLQVLGSLLVPQARLYYWRTKRGMRLTSWLSTAAGCWRSRSRGALRWVSGIRDRCGRSWASMHVRLEGCCYMGAEKSGSWGRESWLCHRVW
jgi:predicted AAA+ superfamily ATPase